MKYFRFTVTSNKQVPIKYLNVAMLDMLHIHEVTKRIKLPDCGHVDISGNICNPIFLPHNLKQDTHMFNTVWNMQNNPYLSALQLLQLELMYHIKRHFNPGQKTRIILSRHANIVWKSFIFWHQNMSSASSVCCVITFSQRLYLSCQSLIINENSKKNVGDRTSTCLTPEGLEKTFWKIVVPFYAGCLYKELTAQ